MERFRQSAGTCLIALALAACSTTASESEATTTDEISSDPTTTVAAEAETTTETTIGVAPPDLQLPAIETTPATAGGPRPELNWEPVPDAALYLVTVFDPSGAPYWAWQGETKSVHVGGEPQLRPEAAGPSVIEGMSWEVIALDGDLALLAASERQDLSP